MSSVPALPYLAELVAVMNDDKARKALAIKLISRKYELNEQWTGWFRSKRYNGGCSIATSVVGYMYDAPSGLKGTIVEHSNRIPFKKGLHCVETWENYKYGIEILHLQPNATGSTYSRKCMMTIKRLKEACKKNGIKKTTGLDKKGLIAALMKV